MTPFFFHLRRPPAIPCLLAAFGDVGRAFGDSRPVVCGVRSVCFPEREHEYAAGLTAAALLLLPLKAVRWFIERFCDDINANVVIDHPRFLPIRRDVPSKSDTSRYTLPIVLEPVERRVSNISWQRLTGGCCATQPFFIRCSSSSPFAALQALAINAARATFADTLLSVARSWSPCRHQVLSAQPQLPWRWRM